MDSNNNIETTLSDSKVVELVKRAFDEYNVLVWNGQEQPTLKPIGQAWSAISEDLRGVKVQVTAVKESVDLHTQLLEGVKRRKQISKAIADGFEYAKKTNGVRILTYLIGIIVGCSGIVSFISNFDKVTGWVIKLF